MRKYQVLEGMRWGLWSFKRTGSKWDNFNMKIFFSSVFEMNLKESGMCCVCHFNESCRFEIYQ